MAKHIDIHVRLDARTFRRFCRFDAFARQRRWYWPALISMVLITASLAGILGWIPMSGAASGLLLGLGIAVPMVNLGVFIISVEVQVATQRLKDAPPVYSLRLDDGGVRVANDQKEEPPVDLPWGNLWAAFRRGGDVYLYVTPDRALILPEGQASASPDALWAFVEARIRK